MDLNEMKSNIEKMEKSNQIDILRILKQNEVQLNENKNGVFINLSTLDNNIIEELNKYITYYNSQEAHLIKQEDIKNELIKTI